MTIQRLKNTNFPTIYKKFLLNKDNSFNYKPIITCALIFINSDNKHIQKLGYSIIVEYCNQVKDYSPLYQTAINMGLYPVAKHIQDYVPNNYNQESIFIELNNAFMETFKFDNVYHSYEQNKLNQFFNEKIDNSISIIAPTSYGKTELILDLIAKNQHKNICILTPTKSLLAQTKQRIQRANIKGIKKILIHPEMYNDNDENIIAVLTQERLLRLLNSSKSISFDFVVIDEAHGLLKSKEREILLASVIILIVKRNKNVVLKYLTPFLQESTSLAVKFTDIDIDSFAIKEYIKSEKFYIYDSKIINGSLLRYDQYLNEFININDNIMLDEFAFIDKYSSEKNIVYLNKPLDIEKAATKLAAICNDVDSKDIDEAIKNISEYIHPQYNLLRYLKKGIVYHHGSVPDSIRLYIERIYSEQIGLKYVVTNSTLLEGVNLPAERMFILDNKRGRSLLSASDFKNLIGRICRFGDIFKQNSSLKKLTPKVYLVNSEYYSSNANLLDFLSTRAKVDKNINDTPENVLLKNTIINDSNNQQYKSALEFIENNEKGAVENFDESLYAKTQVGSCCFKNNISEIPILKCEVDLQNIIDNCSNIQYKIKEANLVIPFISKLFFKYIDENNADLKLQNILRLKNESAQSFYSMFLNWRIKGASYSEMITSFLNYWNSLIDNKKDTIVYVGRWGDIVRGGHQALWTDINYKNINEKINLAITRIKEEQDFLDNTIIKFIEVLNDLGLMDDSLYLKIKYGTDNFSIITLIKNGFSNTLAKLILDKYSRFANISVSDNIVEIQKEIYNEMEANNENKILINEITYFIMNQ